jgi:hypothetical protein
MLRADGFRAYLLAEVNGILRNNRGKLDDGMIELMESPEAISMT